MSDFFENYGNSKSSSEEKREQSDSAKNDFFTNYPGSSETKVADIDEPSLYEQTAQYQEYVEAKTQELEAPPDLDKLFAELITSLKKKFKLS